MRLNNGNLGIGTTNPNAPLEVQNQASATTVENLWLTAPNLTAGQQSRFFWGKNTGSYNGGFFYYYHVGDGSTSNYFRLDFNGKNNVLCAAATGNVGIGTTGPETKLLVKDGEITSNSASTFGQFRAVCGNYGFFIRNDGTDTYLLHTASGDQYGVFNANRPFRINNASALVTMGNGLSVSGGSGYTLDVTGQVRATTGFIVPLFNVNMGTGAGQSVGAGTALVAFNTEETDTNNWFTPTAGNYRYTPQIAGYYQVNWLLVISASATEMFSQLCKNGANYVWGTNTLASSSHYITTGGSAIVQLNGSTDYIDIRIFSNGPTTVNPNGSAFPSRFSGVLVRGA
jgi:hypothetical protein